MTQSRKLAILAAGGPAPGINSVIAAATIRARVSGMDVVGIQDGFHWIMNGVTDKVIPLTVEDATRIHATGGSFIGINRANPAEHDSLIAECAKSLERLEVNHLITIGGDGTVYSAMRLAEQTRGNLRVVHVPKGIDNDLGLPDGIATFGFQTARHEGVRIVSHLQNDARTTSRWYFIVTMGRQAGHLALGIGKAAGASLTIIPEELPEHGVPLRWVVDILVGAIIRRKAEGHNDGTAVLAEGLVARINREDLLPHVTERIADGAKIPVGSVDLGVVLKQKVIERLREFNLEDIIISRNVGYETRCCDPIPLDLEYTRDMGYSATKYLLEGGSGAMITMQHGVFKPIRFEDMLDPVTKLTHVRLVDINTEAYKIARRYMLRLRRDDFSDQDLLERMARIIGTDAEGFRAQFEYLVADEPPPLHYLLA